MAELYPEIEPFKQGMLDVGDGNLVYWETSGSPNGKPAMVLHGGPGSGSIPVFRRYFDPDAYRIVLFDQRGCGKSTPHASDPAVDLATNTTHHLIADVERLREHLGVERWLVFGGSWGATLGLAYAEGHPASVSEIVLVSIANTSRREVEWITREMGRIFPEEWARFRDGVPEGERDGNLAAAYSRLLNDPDPAVREQAGIDWCTWEGVHVSLMRPDQRSSARYDDPVFRMAFARLVTHYWSNAAWLAEGVLLREAENLTGIPGVLVHGRLDVSGPPDIAWDLARRWPKSELVLLEDAGHWSGHAGMTAALVGATDRFVGRHRQ